MNEVPSRQEMFNRAVRGLRAQGYVRAAELAKREDGKEAVVRCVYRDERGNRCAWGHVDTSLRFEDEGSVISMRNLGRGLATWLDDEDLQFAQELQSCHDGGETPDEMEERLRLHGLKYSLEWPS